ncbi:MAG: flagellar biosynthesis protein FlhB [Clostridia bacterium]|nr:flagellar biosynthesis protein FlhB [Clostridia bacterium]
MDLQLFAEERRFPATPKRRREARRRGQVAHSGDLSAAVVLLGVAAVAQWWAPAAARRVAAFAVHLWSTPVGGIWDGQAPYGVLAAATSAFLGAAAPLLAAGALVGAAVGVAQSGFGFSLLAAAPQWSRVNPLAGIGRLFSSRSLVELVKSLLKLAVVGALTYASVARTISAMPVWLESGVGGAMVQVAQATVTLIWRLGLAFLVLAAADYAYQRFMHEQSLRMTRQEVREETRESEGDPQLRARIRRRQREIARRRMLHDVRHADVVVTNPTHYAVALRYRPGIEAAPVVVAKGKGWLALRIRELARAHGVTVMEDPPLARALYAGTRVGQAIPIELYQAVAQVLAYVWRLKGKVS